MTWVVVLHDGGGSMVEAADPSFTAGFPDRAAAEQFCDVLNNAVSRNSYTRQDWWANLFEVPNVTRLQIPVATAAEIDRLTEGKGLGPKERAYDLDELLRKIIEGEDIEVLPPPVKPPTQDEENEALASIARALAPRDP